MQQQYQGRWDLGVSALLLLSPKGSWNFLQKKELIVR
jgi:hypothetical protein